VAVENLAADQDIGIAVTTDLDQAGAIKQRILVHHQVSVKS